MYIINDLKKTVKSGYSTEEFKAVMDYVLTQIKEVETENNTDKCSIFINNTSQYSGSFTYLSINGEQKTIQIDNYSNQVIDDVAVASNMELLMMNSDAPVEFDSTIEVVQEDYMDYRVRYTLIAPTIADAGANINIM